MEVGRRVKLWKKVLSLTLSPSLSFPLSLSLSLTLSYTLSLPPLSPLSLSPIPHHLPLSLSLSLSLPLSLLSLSLSLTTHTLTYTPLLSFLYTCTCIFPLSALFSILGPAYNGSHLASYIRIINILGEDRFTFVSLKIVINCSLSFYLHAWYSYTCTTIEFTIQNDKMRIHPPLNFHDKMRIHPLFL